MSGALWQRLRVHGKRMGVDPRFITELGRLQAAAEFGVTHVVTGFQIAEIYGRFEALHGIGRSARSPSYNASFGDSGTAVHDDLLDPETIKEREKYAAKVEDEFDHLQQYLITLPRAVRDGIESLCVEDRHVPAGLYEPIRLFLARMAVILEQRRKSKGQHQQHLSAQKAKAALAAATPRPKRQAPRAEAPKVNVERVAFFRAVRALRPDLAGLEIKDAYEFYRALKDKTAMRVKEDRKRKEGAFAPAPAAPASTNPNTDRPVLGLPGQHKELA